MARLHKTRRAVKDICIAGSLRKVYLVAPQSMDSNGAVAYYGDGEEQRGYGRVIDVRLAIRGRSRVSTLGTA
jgi:hypothetical protein